MKAIILKPVVWNTKNYIEPYSQAIKQQVDLLKTMGMVMKSGTILQAISGEGNEYFTQKRQKSC